MGDLNSLNMNTQAQLYRNDHAGPCAVELPGLTENPPPSADTCSLRACNPSAILPRLGCLLCSAEHRVHLSLSGLWSYTTRWDTIEARGCGDQLTWIFG